MRQIAVSKCLMFLRSPWNRARLRLELTDDGNGSRDGAGPLLAALAVPAPRAECLDVERALASLSSTARAVIWLYEVEGNYLLSLKRPMKPHAQAQAASGGPGRPDTRRAGSFCGQRAAAPSMRYVRSRRRRSAAVFSGRWCGQATDEALVVLEDRGQRVERIDPLLDGAGNVAPESSKDPRPDVRAEAAGDLLPY